jgi:hypothetical protein
MKTKETKTKKLTFLLALTFLFLFSSSVYGEEEEKDLQEINLKCVWLKDERMVEYTNIKYKEKNIYYYYSDILIEKYKITKVENRFIEGSILVKDTKKNFIRINRYSGLLRTSSCNPEKEGDCENPKQNSISSCEVIERKF